MTEKSYKEIGCLDVGPETGCAFQVRAETEDELLRHAAEHGRLVHKVEMAEFTPELTARVKSLIRTVTVTVP